MADRVVLSLSERSLEFLKSHSPSILLGDYAKTSVFVVFLLSLAYFVHAALYAIFGTAKLPVVNRRSFLEPNVFSRVRFAFGSVKILDDAYKKYRDRPYLLARGDADMIVLPAKSIADLNKIPQDWLNMRKFLCMTLSGSLNGMNSVLETGVHVKALLFRVSPLLVRLVEPMSTRIQTSLLELLPQDTTSWVEVEPTQAIVHAVSQTITLATFGPPLCDDPELVRLCYEHTTNMFGIPFVMRFVPKFLQPVLVWLLPQRWQTVRGWRLMRKFVKAKIQSLPEIKGTEVLPDIISWMYQDAKGPEKHDINLFTQLVGTTMAGGTFSTAGLIVGLIAELVAHPEALEEIRAEIRETQENVQGKWDQAVFNKLEKLDSALKETLRLKPGSLLVYSREVVKDFTMNGVKLRKGQLITTSGHSQATDATVFPQPNEFQALRAYNIDLERHRAHPFRTVEGDDHRWGSGRWACPGRFLASNAAKIILVKILDEYDFKFVEGQQLERSVVHDFVFIDPSSRIMMRRKATNSGIVY